MDLPTSGSSGGGQSSKRQTDFSTLSPSHSVPPNAGLGFEQIRFRDFTDFVPQVALHDDHEDQEVQLPFPANAT